MFHSQHCQHQGVCPDKTLVARMTFLPRATSPTVIFHPSPARPALQMEMSLTSLHRLTIWLILFSDQAKSSLFSAASLILFSLFCSPCPYLPALAPFTFLLAVCSSTCCLLVSPRCLKLLQLPGFVARVLLFSKIHHFTSFSPSGDLRHLSEVLACLQMWFPWCRVTWKSRSL